jgi:hypothetical protein
MAEHCAPDEILKTWNFKISRFQNFQDFKILYRIEDVTSSQFAQKEYFREMEAILHRVFSAIGKAQRGRPIAPLVLGAQPDALVGVSVAGPPR